MQIRGKMLHKCRMENVSFAAEMKINCFIRLFDVCVWPGTTLEFRTHSKSGTEIFQGMFYIYSGHNFLKRK